MNSSHQILAFSSSRSGNSGYLETAAPEIKNFLGSKPTNIAFIPFASTDNNYHEYAASVAEGLKGLPVKINVALPENARSVVEKSDAIMVGGGNTFKLIHDLYELNLLDVIRMKIDNGTPFIGWSAGSNILNPTISTTNDMPVIEPKSFKALNIFPFQTNPHYFNDKTEGFNGETRDMRLIEFITLNPGIPVVGLPEGSALWLENNQLQYIGENNGVLFAGGDNNKSSLSPGMDINYLLKP